MILVNWVQRHMMDIHINKEDNHISTTQKCKYLNKSSMKSYLHDFNNIV